MTLYDVMALILRYFANSAASGAHCVKVIEDIPKWPKLSATKKM